MIDRYLDKQINEIWNEDNKLKVWLDVEIAVIEGWNKLGLVPIKDLKKIKSNAIINRERMLEIENTTKHDVVAFTRMISENLGEEKKWVHLGLTSTDIVDTAQNFLIKQSNDVFQVKLDKIKKTLKEKANEYKETIIMGRTHGIYGEPTSLGLKFLLWLEEINRQQERFNLARKQIEVTKISGSMGNFANLELEIQDEVAKILNLDVDNLSTQVTQRDRHAFLISVFGNIASTLEKISTEIRLLQRSEVQELCEGFLKGQKGSSSMPHKKNPISTENICGLSRFLRSFVNTAYENNILWHERDISHSSNERIIFPDVFNILCYTLNRLDGVLQNIYVNKNKIEEHIKSQNRVFFSQRILTYILMNTKFSREEVYDFIQECTLQCLSEEKDFKEILLQNKIDKYISQKELEELFNINYFLRNVEKIYRRVI